MMKETVLIVDDDVQWRSEFENMLKEQFPQIEVLACGSKQEALQILKVNPVNVVIADMRMEDQEAGYDLLRFIKKQNPRTQVIVLTAYDSLDCAVRCMRAGCFTYLSKLAEIDQLMDEIGTTLELSCFCVDRESLEERLILSYWEEVRRATDVAKKGIALESLCFLLFRSVPGWQQVESRVRSSTEEFDVVILNESREEFWEKYGTFIIVECKNWTGKKKPGRNEFDAFYAKLARRGRSDCRLGFFVSLRGVARTFRAELERIAKEGIVIVCMTEDDLWSLICADNRSRFLKGQVAEQVLGKKSIVQ